MMLRPHYLIYLRTLNPFVLKMQLENCNPHAVNLYTEDLVFYWSSMHYDARSHLKVTHKNLKSRQSRI